MSEKEFNDQFKAIVRKAEEINRENSRDQFLESLGGYTYSYDIKDVGFYKLNYPARYQQGPFELGKGTLYEAKKCVIHFMKDSFTHNKSLNFIFSNQDKEALDFHFHTDASQNYHNNHVHIYDDSGSRFHFRLYDKTPIKLFLHNADKNKENRTTTLLGRLADQKLHIIRPDQKALKINFEDKELLGANVTITGHYLFSGLEFDDIKNSSLTTNINAHHVKIDGVNESGVTFNKPATYVELNNIINSNIHFKNNHFETVKMNKTSIDNNLPGHARLFANHATINTLSFDLTNIENAITLDSSSIGELNLLECGEKSMKRKVTSFKFENSSIKTLNRQTNYAFKDKHIYEISLDNSDQQDLSIFRDMNIDFLRVESDKNGPKGLDEFVSNVRRNFLTVKDFLPKEKIILGKQTLNIRCNQLHSTLAAHNSNINFRCKVTKFNKETVIRDSEVKINVYLNRWEWQYKRDIVAKETVLNGQFINTDLIIHKSDILSMGEFKIKNRDQKIEFKRIGELNVTGSFESNIGFNLSCNHFVISENAKMTVHEPCKIEVSNMNGLDIRKGTLKLHVNSSIYVAGKKLRDSEANMKKYAHIFCLGE